MIPSEAPDDQPESEVLRNRGSGKSESDQPEVSQLRFPEERLGQLCPRLCGGDCEAR
jgi:hypothetical protein